MACRTSQQWTASHSITSIPIQSCSKLSEVVSTPLSFSSLGSPIPTGTRGGAAEFKWSDVKADKDRENYLGHSINAPQGRWQNHKDIHWYNRNKSDVIDEDAVRREKAREIKEIKMREENELSIALGYGPVHDLERIGMDEAEGGEVRGEGSAVKTERELELEKLEAEEKRRRKE